MLRLVTIVRTPRVKLSGPITADEFTSSKLRCAQVSQARLDPNLYKQLSPYIDELGGSNSTRVTLRGVDKELTGLYKCEVSGDAPLFYTAIRSTHVVVTVEPDSEPEISLEKVKFTLGERVRANCSSRPAFPAANLTFFMNGRKVDRGEDTRLWWYLKSEDQGLESSRLELEVPYPGGSLELSCKAVQYSLYSRTTRVFLLEETPLLAHVLGPTSSGTGSKSCAGPSYELTFLRMLLAALSLITAARNR